MTEPRQPGQLAESERLIGRNGAIWRDHVHGATSDTIAARYGLSVAAVRGILQSVKLSIPARDREAMILREYELANMQREAMTRILACGPQPLTTAGGRVVRDDDGVIVREDFGQVIAASRQLIRIQDFLARVFALYAPTKVDITTADAVDVAVAELAERMRQRAAGEVPADAAPVD